MTWKCPNCGREYARPEEAHFCGTPTTVEEYILAQEEDFRPRLWEVRALFRKALPEAEECISWAMPTYRKGKNLIHFAAAKKHLGIYPGSEATVFFAHELEGYSVSKGTIRIPWSAPLPAALLEKIARWCGEGA